MLNVRATGPLPNGVAAGDATQTSAVLWARATVAGNVLFEYSTDSTFKANLFTQTASITDPFQPAKVTITGLTPATTYFYRVTDAGAATGTGRFHTPHAAGERAGLRFGVSGDWEAELAPFPSISNAGERSLDFFIEHGDTIVSGAATTTAAYRLKHNEVYSTYFGLNLWAGLRSSTAILAMIDDNDVNNDFAGGAPPSSNPKFDNTGNFINETNRYRNALQAFQEYNPLNDQFYGNTGDSRTANKRKLYRFKTYGDDAAIFLLDTRSFRDEQLDRPSFSNAISVTQFLNATFTPGRTLLGAQQLADLKAGLQQAQANGTTWKFILTPSPIQNLGVFKAEDRYEGYAAERTELLRFINDNKIENVVFIAAGLHGTLVNNLTYQTSAFGVKIPVKAFEIIVGPVAIDPPHGPFGPEVTLLAKNAGLIDQAEYDDYNSRTRAGKDQFIKTLVNDKLLTPSPLNYDPLGLEGSGLAATLLVGDYISAHTYGWTEFDIDQTTQVLTVTTYGIDFYTAAELQLNPSSILSQTPAIVSQFVVTPSLPNPLVNIYLPLTLKE